MTLGAQSLIALRNIKMASRITRRLSVPTTRALLCLTPAARRGLAVWPITQSGGVLGKTNSIFVHRRAFQLSFRRGFADAPTTNLPPTPKPKKRFRFFRFLWRVTYLSLIGGVLYVSYLVYDLQHPSDQFEPDPKKKSLVILGEKCCTIDGACH